MNVTFDQLLVGAAILGAVAFFVAPLFRREKKGCSSGCGCSVAKKPIGAKRS